MFSCNDREEKDSRRVRWGMLVVSYMQDNKVDQRRKLLFQIKDSAPKVANGTAVVGEGIPGDRLWG